MKQRKKTVATVMNPMTWWWDLAAQSAEMMSASAEVIVRRNIQMSAMTARPSASHRRELTTMVTEKVEASQRSAAAMMASASPAYRAASSFWINQWMANAGLGRRGPSAAETVASAAQASAKVLKAGMQPYRRRAVSNAKRLRKTGPSR